MFKKGRFITEEDVETFDKNLCPWRRSRDYELFGNKSPLGQEIKIGKGSAIVMTDGVAEIVNAPRNVSRSSEQWHAAGPKPSFRLELR